MASAAIARKRAEMGPVDDDSDHEESYDDFDLPFRDPNFPLRLFTNNEVEAINKKLTASRSRRVRAALYPETFESEAAADEEILSAAYTTAESAVMSLAPAARELKDAIADIVAYALDADFAEKFIPQICKLLADDDSDVVRNAAELTSDLVKSEAACHVIARSPQMVAALLKAAGSPGETKNDIRVKEAVASALLLLGRHEHGRLTVFKTGGIELLVKLLAAPAEKVVNYAISTLHGLLNYQEGSKLAVRMAGGIQRMVPLLSKWGRDPRFLAVVCDCLHLLAFGDAEAKLAIWNSGGPREVVAVFEKAKEDKLLWTSSRLLKVLSTESRNKEQIVESGGFDHMVKRLGTDDQKLFQNYITTLRNLSDAEADFPCDSTMISYLLQFLRRPGDPETVEYAAGIFGNLSSDKPRLKEAIFYAGGVDILLQTVRKTESEDTLEPLLCTLRHLTSKHREVSSVQKEMRDLGGLELALHQMGLSWQRNKGEISWALVKASCGLVRNLAADEENHDQLVRHKVIPRLGQVLALAAKEDRKHLEAMSSAASASPSSSSGAIAARQSRHSLHRSATLQTGSTASMVGGVDLNDVKETSIGALAILARASIVNKEEVAALNVGPLLIKLRHEPTSSEDVADACTALLEELRLEEEEEGGPDAAARRGRAERWRKKVEAEKQEQMGDREKKDEEFGVKVEAGDRVIVARARNILEDAPDADAATGRSATLDGRGRGGWGRRGSASSEAGAGAGATGSLKRMAKEGEEKRRRGIFGGGKKKEKRKDREKQEDPIYENMESIAGPREPAAAAAEEGEERKGGGGKEDKKRDKKAKDQKQPDKKKEKAKPRMKEEPVWIQDSN